MATSGKTKNKAKSGNPAVSGGKKTWTPRSGEDLLLPSGNTARVRRPGPEALLKEGVLPDALADVVSKAIETGKGLKPKEVKDLSKNSETLLGMMDTMDKVLVAVVVYPPVKYHKVVREGDGWRSALPTDSDPVTIPDSDRDPDQIYSDDVDFEDKSFIFNFAVGGTRDLARFRREAQLPVGAVSDVESDGESSE